MPEGEQRKCLQAYLRQDRERGFDFSEAPLMRLCLIRADERSHYFVWSSHHALLDGWSCALLIQELVTYYGAYCRGEELDLPASRPFRDYITWLQRQSVSSAEAFWRRTLLGFHSPTPLPTRPNHLSETENAQRSEQEQILPPSITSVLHSIARQSQVTLNTIVQGAWALVLAHYSGCGDVVFGAIVSGRPATLTGIGTMVGMFTNTLPLRAQIDPREWLVAFFRRLQQQQA